MNQPSDQAAFSGEASPVGQVGYGKPPEQHRFKKGVSGNPRGRPRRPSLGADKLPSAWSGAVLKEANRKIKATENGKICTVTVLEAILRGLSNRGMKGDNHAARILLEHARGAEQENRKYRRREFEREVDHKRRTERDIHHSDVLGLKPHDPVPHPADMQVDSKNERVLIIGPSNTAEKAEWDTAETLRQEIRGSISDLEGVLIGPESELESYNGSRALVASLIEESHIELAELDADYPSEEQRRQHGSSSGWPRRQNGDRGAERVAHSSPIAVQPGAGRPLITERELKTDLKRAVKEAVKLGRQYAGCDDDQEPF